MLQRGLTAPLVVVEGQTDRSMVLSLIGDLDLAAAPRFVSTAADALRCGREALVVDLTEVSFVDSAGLAALLNVLRRATTAGANLVLVGVAPPINAVFSRTRLDRAFTFADTQADAERFAADPR